MVRLFTLNIHFRNHDYIALVSMRRDCNELHCLVRYIDKGIEYLLPGDNLIFTLDGQLKAPDHLPETLCKTLTQCTAAAISTYLLESSKQAA